jgi:hypothetical protein
MTSVLHIALSPVLQVIAVIAVTASASWRAWIAYRRIVIREKERTSRLTRAIDGADPCERPEIIRACSLLERAGRHELETRDHRIATSSRSTSRPLLLPCEGRDDGEA